MSSAATRTFETKMPTAARRARVTAAFATFNLCMHCSDAFLQRCGACGTACAINRGASYNKLGDCVVRLREKKNPGSSGGTKTRGGGTAEGGRRKVEAFSARSARSSGKFCEALHK